LAGRIILDAIWTLIPDGGDVNLALVSEAQDEALFAQTETLTLDKFRHRVAI
jgi:hypothetical protein